MDKRKIFTAIMAISMLITTFSGCSSNQKQSYGNLGKGDESDRPEVEDIVIDNESDEEQLRRFIIEELHSGATVYEAIGAYNLEKHNEIITIVDKSEYQKLMNFINREDPKAFITVYTVSDMRYQPKVWEKK